MTIYTSGMQAIQGRTVNHDPKPWHISHGYGAAYRSGRSSVLGGESLNAPRPEFDVLDNPILAQFRKDVGYWENFDGTEMTAPEVARSYLDLGEVGPIGEADMQHAARVLQKLAALA